MHSPGARQGVTMPDSTAYRIGRRSIDLAAALLVAALSAPVMVLALPWLVWRGRAAIRTGVFVGRFGKPITLYSLALRRGHAQDSTALIRIIAHWPRLLGLLQGHLTLIGPRPVQAAELHVFGDIRHPRFGVTPGMACLWWLRRRANIDFGSEADADLDYLATRSLTRDCAMLARVLFALVYGRGTAHCTALNRIAGIRLLNLSMENVLDAVVVALDRGVRTRVAFVNPDCVNIAAREPAYRKALEGFDWVCADGIGMKIAGSLLGRPVRQNVNGTDLFPRLCAALAGTSHSLFLLGARPGVAEAAGRWATTRHPGLKLAGTRSGYFSGTEEHELLEEIRASGATVLLVAMGAPRQEIWLERNLGATGALVGMGVGGLFDFYSGRIRRAPVWLREIGGEWVYRFLQEPGRMWRRYLVGNWLFIFRILGEKFSAPKFKGTGI